jgi:hypothetical protein
MGLKDLFMIGKVLVKTAKKVREDRIDAADLAQRPMPEVLDAWVTSMNRFLSCGAQRLGRRRQRIRSRKPSGASALPCPTKSALSMQPATASTPRPAPAPSRIRSSA